MRDDEVRRLNLQLGQSEKLASIGTLAAGVAHEINNPVGVIRNKAEILRYRISDGERSEDHHKRGPETEEPAGNHRFAGRAGKDRDRDIEPEPDREGSPGARADERAEVALVREIEEEMGLIARCGRFLGAVEHCFEQKGQTHCEVNLVFALEIDGVDAACAPVSCEDYIEFCWQPLAELGRSILEPAPLRECVVAWLDGSGVGWESGGHWA